MICFCDLRAAGIAGVRFAFWDTVFDHFIKDDISCQGWDDWSDFCDGFSFTETLSYERLIGLCPKWVFEKAADEGFSDDVYAVMRASPP